MADASPRVFNPMKRDRRFSRVVSWYCLGKSIDVDWWQDGALVCGLWRDRGWTAFLRQLWLFFKLCFDCTNDIQTALKAMFKKKEKPLDVIHLTHLMHWKDDWTWSPTHQSWRPSVPVTGCVTSAGNCLFLCLCHLTCKGERLLPLRDLERTGELSESTYVEALGTVSGVW